MWTYQITTGDAHTIVVVQVGVLPEVYVHIILLQVNNSQWLMLIFFKLYFLWFILKMLCGLLLQPLQSVNLCKYFYYMAIQNLVYWCRNFHLTSVDNIKSPSMSNMCSKSSKWLSGLLKSHSSTTLKMAHWIKQVLIQCVSP